MRLEWLGNAFCSLKSSNKRNKSFLGGVLTFLDTLWLLIYGGFESSGVNNMGLIINILTLQCTFMVWGCFSCLFCFLLLLFVWCLLWLVPSPAPETSTHICKYLSVLPSLKPASSLNSWWDCKIPTTSHSPQKGCYALSRDFNSSCK